MCNCMAHYIPPNCDVKMIQVLRCSQILFLSFRSPTGSLKTLVCLRPSRSLSTNSWTISMPLRMVTETYHVSSNNSLPLCFEFAWVFSWSCLQETANGGKCHTVIYDCSQVFMLLHETKVALQCSLVVEIWQCFLTQITTGSTPQMCSTQSGTSPPRRCLVCPASLLTTALPVTQVCSLVLACRHLYVLVGALVSTWTYHSMEVCWKLSHKNTPNPFLLNFATFVKLFIIVKDCIYANPFSLYITISLQLHHEPSHLCREHQTCRSVCVFLSDS